MHMNLKKALITGITGQDGSYLADFLLKKGYEVHGIKRRASSFNTKRIDHIYEDSHFDSQRFFLHYGDLTDSTNIIKTIQKIVPDEIYNLGAQSHVGVSFDSPEYTANCDALGTLRILEAIKILGLNKKTKFYQASTSELYGLIQESPQSETTPFYPRSPYAVSKLFAHWITINYRESYGIFACNGILFNHESPRRGETFVTRKITRAFARISLGLEKCLYIGNLNAMRDWGHSKDYVAMQWLMLQQDKPDDFVISTGKMTSVKEFIELSAIKMGWKVNNKGHAIIWKGENLEEVGIKVETNEIVVRVDPKYYRPCEVSQLLGDSSKAARELGWEPEYSLDELIEEMIFNDKEIAKEELVLKKNNSINYSKISHK